MSPTIDPVELIDSSPDGILICDAEGTIVLVNRRAEALFDYERSDLVGRPIELLVPEPVREVHVAHRARYQDKPEPRPMGSGLELTGRTRDGRLVPVEISLSPIDSPDGMLIFAAVRDVTERRAAEADRRRNRVQIRVLEERERLARDLHDLVIQRIFAAGLRLQSAQALTEDAGIAERIADTISQLDETIVELRNAIFRLNRPLALTVADRLRTIVDDAAGSLGLQPTLTQRGDPAAIPDPVADELEPALYEMLANVWRHARPGRVEVEIEVGDDEVEVTVTDDGAGFDPDAGGDGSGLPNLRRRAESLGGHFRVESEVGRGTTIRWTAALEPTGRGASS